MEIRWENGRLRWMLCSSLMLCHFHCSPLSQISFSTQIILSHARSLSLSLLFGFFSLCVSFLFGSSIPIFYSFKIECNSREKKTRFNLNRGTDKSLKLIDDVLEKKYKNYTNWWANRVGFDSITFGLLLYWFASFSPSRSHSNGYIIWKQEIWIRYVDPRSEHQTITQWNELEIKSNRTH